jgi:hypothetical protein
MIRLNLKKEPYWLDLIPGVRVKVAPFTSAIMSAASTSPALRALPPETDQDMRFFVLTVEVAKLAILDWDGVGDEAGEPAAVTPEGIAALLDIYQIARAFGVQYVTRGLLVSAEGNV